MRKWYRRFVVFILVLFMLWVASKLNLFQFNSHRVDGDVSFNPNQTIVSLPDDSKPEHFIPSESDEKTDSSDYPDSTSESVPADSYLRVDFVDVGQADFIVIECDGFFMTIDGGNVADSQLVYSYLEQREIETISTAVISHAHEDHCGGVSAILSHSEVETLYCPVTSYDTKAFQNVVSKAAEQGLEITVPEAGDVFMIGSATAEIIGPVESYSDPNNTSIVIRLVYGETAFLFTGDAEWAAEQDILDAGFDVSADVLKIGHHGSSTSSSYRWLREVMPEICVISSNSEEAPEYGHPHEEVLSRLDDLGALVYRTDQMGTITLFSDGEAISFS